MREYRIDREMSGQRLDKFCRRVLPCAPASFCYKMLRKKNIKLNGKKASGGELLKSGDRVTFFLSDATFEKFHEPVQDLSESLSGYEKARKELSSALGPDPIVYEDGDVVIVCKPAGILSQKAKPEDVSVNEWIVGYMVRKWKTQDHLSDEECVQKIRQFRPSICSRLDRNTGGILICAVSLPGSRTISGLLRERTIRKFYRMVVAGRVTESGSIGGWLYKDEKTNKVELWDNAEEAPEGAREIRTLYRPVRYSEDADLTLVEAELVTGKTHQLRAHMASIGHPILGDDKYGDRARNRRQNIHGQLLFCCRIEFPKDTGVLTQLSGRTFSVREPERFERVMRRGK